MNWILVVLILEKHFHDISFPFVVTFTNPDMLFHHSGHHSHFLHHKSIPEGYIYLWTDTKTDDPDTMFSHVLALCDNV